MGSLIGKNSVVASAESQEGGTPQREEVWSRKRVLGHQVAPTKKMWQQADPGLLSIRSE